MTAQGDQREMNSVTEIPNPAEQNSVIDVERRTAPVGERLYRFISQPSIPSRGKQRQIVLGIMASAKEPLSLSKIAELADEQGLKAIGGVEPSCRYHLHHLCKLGHIEIVSSQSTTPRPTNVPGGMFTYGMTFRPHPEAGLRRDSASTLMKLLLASKDTGILPEHVRALIDTLLWKMTEADGKYNTRYKSGGALKCIDKSQLRHEHVYQKSKMIEALLNADLEAVDSILNDAIGCTVTVDEHLRLGKYDSEYGWERYRKAGLEVFDAVTGRRKI